MKRLLLLPLLLATTTLPQGTAPKKDAFRHRIIHCAGDREIRMLHYDNALCNNWQSIVDVLSDGEEIHAHKNKLTSINHPVSVEDFRKLATVPKIDLHYNAISALKDDQFACYTALTGLDISNNKIETIGNNVFPKALESLDLSDNKLTEVPSGIYLLPKLRSLLVSNNRIPAGEIERLRTWWWTTNKKGVSKEFLFASNQDTEPTVALIRENLSFVDGFRDLIPYVLQYLGHETPRAASTATITVEN